jgi:NitT/TauT family transport system substrate-binding protein
MIARTVFVLLLMFGISSVRAGETVTFATDWKAQAEQGGFYQALATGLYEKHGLTVKFRQGGPQTNGMQLIAAGAVDFAMASNAFFIANFVRAKAPVVAVMASFQKDPQVLITHPRDDVRSLADMKDKPIMLAKDSVTAFWPWLKKKYGFSDSQIRPYTFNVAPFMVDRNAIQEGYLGSEPYQIGKAGGDLPQTFLLSDNGYPGYAAMVVTQQRLADAKPELVRAFVAASIEGWRDYLDGDPTPGNRLIKQANPEMTDDLIAYGRAQLKKNGIVENDDTARGGIGMMTDGRWQEFLRQMAEVGVCPPDLPIKTGYRLDFLPNRPAHP